MFITVGLYGIILDLYSELPNYYSKSYKLNKHDFYTDMHNSYHNNNNNHQDMTKLTLLLCIVFIFCYPTQGAVTMNQITGVTANNLMYTGTIGVGSEKLFYIFYGVDG